MTKITRTTMIKTMVMPMTDNGTGGRDDDNNNKTEAATTTVGGLQIIY